MKDRVDEVFLKLLFGLFVTDDIIDTKLTNLSRTANLNLKRNRSGECLFKILNLYDKFTQFFLSELSRVFQPLHGEHSTKRGRCSLTAQISKVGTGKSIGVLGQCAQGDILVKGH